MAIILEPPMCVVITPISMYIHVFSTILGSQFIQPACMQKKFGCHPVTVRTKLLSSGQVHPAATCG